MLKRIILLATALLLIISMISCGASPSGTTTESAATTAGTTAAATESATAAATSAAQTTAQAETTTATTKDIAIPSSTTTTAAATNAAEAAGGSVNGYDGPDKDIVTPRGMFPIVKESVPLRVAMTQNPRVENYDDNEFTKYVTDTTGIELVFELLPAQDTVAKVNLQFASNDLPDVYMGGSYMTVDMLMEYGEDGMLVALNDYIDVFGENIFTFFDQAANPFSKALITSPDGNIYTLPQLVEEYHGIFSERCWIYKPFLDALGLEMPTTTDEFTNVLRAFKDNDPNGNGKQDEIPLMYFNETVGGPRYMARFFLNSFLYWDTQDHMLVNDGKLSPAYYAPEFKQGLEWMNMLAGEGLIDPATFTQDQNTLIAILNAEEAQVGVIPHAWVDSGWIDVASQRRHDYVFMAPLTGPGGVRYTNEILPGISNSYQVTSACPYPAVAYRLGDFLLDTYVSMVNRYGFEDRDWRYVDAAEGKVALNRGAAKWELINDVWQYATTNVYWYRVGAHFHPLGIFDSLVWDGDPFSYNYILTESSFVLDGMQPKEYVPRGKAWLPEELDVYLDLRPNIDTYLWENISKFMIGDRSFDEWDAFQTEMSALGVDNFVEVLQSCYTRMIGS